MNFTSVAPLARAAAFGAATGIRSQLPLAVLAHAAARGDIAVADERSLAWLRAPRVAQAMTVSAVGELLVDKLPIVPARTEPGP